MYFFWNARFDNESEEGDSEGEKDKSPALLERSGSSSSQTSTTCLQRYGSASSSQKGHICRPRKDPLKNVPTTYFSSSAKKSRARGGGRKSVYSSPPLPPVAQDTTFESHCQEQGMLLARVIEATNDITPRRPKLVPFPYWDTHQTTLCAVQLIQRFPDLIAYPESFYHDIPQMIHRWASVIRTKANNERAAQIRSIKHIWFNSFSQYSLAYTLL